MLEVICTDAEFEKRHLTSRSMISTGTSSGSRRETHYELYSAALGVQFDRRYFQHDLVSYLKLKGFPSYVNIALLMITSGLDAALDLNDFLSRLVDDLWTSELTISNFSPSDSFLAAWMSRSSTTLGLVLGFQ
ncbi:hypothetical protein Tco_0738288 [Tanacetum coccineum]